MKPRENDRIYDPTCGSGGLLLKAFKKVPNGKAAVYGQELNAQTWALCTMNMFLHSVDDAKIWQGDTLANPQNVAEGQLMKFQCVVANPPFSLDKWDGGFLSGTRAEGKDKKKEIGQSSQNSFLKLIEDNIRDNWDIDALTDKLGKAVGTVYGWSFPTETKEKVRTER